MRLWNPFFIRKYVWTHSFTQVTVTGETTLISAPGVGKRLVIRRVYINNADTAFGEVELRDGSGGTAFLDVGLAEKGGDIIRDFGDGINLSENTALVAHLTTTTKINITVFYQTKDV
jgi:hypothetical protein